MGEGFFDSTAIIKERDFAQNSTCDLMDNHKGGQPLWLPLRLCAGGAEEFGGVEVALEQPGEIILQQGFHLLTGGR